MERAEFYSGRERTRDKEVLLQCFFGIAEVYRLAGRPEQAMIYYKKAEKGPNPLFQYESTDVLQKLAEYYRDRGELKNAERLVKRALLHTEEKGASKYSHLSFIYATILFEQNNQEKAGLVAKSYLEELLNQKGGEDRLLMDKRYCQMHLYELAILKICMGEWQQAECYLTKMRECKLCVSCEKWDCFEYCYGMGLIAEHKGDFVSAKELYEKALRIKEDYPCAGRHLEKISKMGNNESFEA